MKMSIQRTRPGAGRCLSPAVAAHLAAVCLLTYSLACSAPDEGPGPVSIRLGSHVGRSVDEAAVPLIVVDHDPNIVYSSMKLERSFGSSEEMFAEFVRRIGEHTVARATIEPGRRATVESPGPGLYWIVSTRPLQSGGESLVWSHPFRMEPGDGGAKIVLSRSNVAMITRPVTVQ